MQETDPLAAELEQTRSDLLELTARVRRLIGKRSQRDLLLQKLRRSAAMPADPPPEVISHHLCSLCVTSYASKALHHVRSVAAGTKCDHCGQPAIVWLQLKPDHASENENQSETNNEHARAVTFTPA